MPAPIVAELKLSACIRSAVGSSGAGSERLKRPSSPCIAPPTLALGSTRVSNFQRRPNRLRFAIYNDSWNWIGFGECTPAARDLDILTCPSFLVLLAGFDFSGYTGQRLDRSTAACTCVNITSHSWRISAALAFIGPQWVRMFRKPTAANSAANAGDALDKR